MAVERAGGVVTPQRIQLSRTRGWRKPDSAIVVARPSRWGNPFTIHRAPAMAANGDWGIYIAYRSGHVLRTRIPDMATARQIAVNMFLTELQNECDDQGVTVAEMLAPLRGHDLCCWCPLGQPCHADVLLEMANSR